MTARLGISWMAAMLRDVVCRRRRWAHTPVIYAASHFYHEKRVDHELLLHRLCVHFGIRGKALAWFTSYLTGHRQYVTIRGADSSSCSVMHGVPQGSVLGPLLFCILSHYGALFGNME